MNRCAQFLITLALISLSYQGYAVDCPLKGSWDTGFTTLGGTHQTRILMTFDCHGHTEMDAWFLQGKMFSPGGVRYHRSGRYTLTGSNSEIPNAFNVNIIVDALTIAYLDQNSVAGAASSRSNCRTENPQLLVPTSILGKQCEAAKYPSQGFIERAVVLFEGNKFYWSFFGGDKRVVIQPPSESLRRINVVDHNRTFLKLAQ